MRLRYILEVRLKYKTETLDFVTSRLYLIYYSFQSLTGLYGLFRKYMHIGHGFFQV